MARCDERAGELDRLNALMRQLDDVLEDARRLRSLIDKANARLAAFRAKHEPTDSPH